MLSHRMSNTPEYAAWSHLRSRCNNPDHPAYKNYGGRGIRVWPEWDRPGGGFEAFFAHVGARPSSGHEIDRVNNDRGYEPGNVRWVPRDVNLRNKRTTRMIVVDGRSQCLSEWARETGLSTALILFRLKSGWGAADAVRIPPGEAARRIGAPVAPHEGERFEVNGHTLTISEWADASGIKAETIYGRLRRGWPIERAVTEALVPAFKEGARETRTCPQCHSAFEAYTKTKKAFCSQACFRSSRTVVMTCGWCGVCFSHSVGKAKRISGYCSRPCAAKGNGARKTASCGPQTWRCLSCGEQVSRKEYTRCAKCFKSQRSA